MTAPGLPDAIREALAAVREPLHDGADEVSLNRTRASGAIRRSDKMAYWKIGDKVYWHDANKRTYRRDENNRPFGSPIYSGSFRCGEIAAETSRSWVVHEFCREVGKIAKKTGQGRPRESYCGPFLTEEEMRRDIDANENAAEIHSWWQALGAHQRAEIWRAHVRIVPAESPE